MAVFSNCGNITAQAAESVGTSFAAESAGDFLFQLDHSDIPFAEIIVERNPKIGHETEHILQVAL